MRRALGSLVLAVALAAFAQSSQPFDLVIAGRIVVCGIPLSGQQFLQYIGGQQELPSDIDAIAPAGSGRVFALVNPRAEIVEIHPDLTRTPVFGGIDGVSGRRFVLDAAGDIYLATTAGRLLAIEADGTVRADVALDVAAMDLAADQCTLFYTDLFASGLRRFNVCSGTPLPDFAAGTFLDFKILPDRGLVAVRRDASGVFVSRYDAAGALTQTFPPIDDDEFGFAALGLGRGGQTMLTKVQCEDTIEEYDLATGALLRTVSVGVDLGVEHILAYRGFAAALGPTAPAEVPSLSTTMLFGLAALLALTALRRLM